MVLSKINPKIFTKFPPSFDFLYEPLSLILRYLNVNKNK